MRALRVGPVLVVLLGGVAVILLGLPGPSVDAPDEEGTGTAVRIVARAPQGSPLLDRDAVAADAAGDAGAGGGASGAGTADQDAVAGVLARTVPPVGTGTSTVVPGTVAAPGPGTVRTVRVEVEGGLPVDATAFADFVMDTLNDPRGWGRDGEVSFARTDGDATTTVVLASPETSARLCRPLDTRGTLSCRNGPKVVLTHYRWVEGHPDYGTDLTGYRRYVVNHEMGHALGHGHVRCPAPGAPAPVMQQQTLGLDGCAPNPWP